MVFMNQFKSFGLKPEIVEAVEQLGFQTPTPIQNEAIPILLSGQSDLIGLARTGTGKTAAFGLPLIHLSDFSQPFTQALVLCPTRELCVQITKDLTSFVQNTGPANIVAVYGGTSIIKQINELKRGAHIIVATPGRLMDLMKRGSVDLSTVDYVVLDEADEMLNMGFKDDIDTILASVNDTRSTWLFSATMSNDIRAIARKYMVAPREVAVDAHNTTAAAIEHVYYVTRAREKYASLKRIVDFHPRMFGIVFTNTKVEAQEIAERLIKDGYNADALHGDLSQQQRDKVMGRFRERSIQLLIATDVAARGIDVSDITHVIHFSIPDELESYTHRSGRTARAGKEGVSISIIHSRELGKLKQLERITKNRFKQLDIPSGVEVCEKQLFHIIHNVHNVEVDNHAIDPYLPKIMEELSGLDKEELIKRFASIEFNRFLQYYKDAPDLNYSHEEHGERERISNDNFTDMRIQLGTKDGFDKGKLFRYILDTTGFRKAAVGRIVTKDIVSFFGLDNSLIERALQTFNGLTYNGRKVKVEVSGSSSKVGGRSTFKSNGRSKYSDNKFSDGKPGESKSGDGKKEFYTTFAKKKRKK
jgi:ATP-dependent RNA helicase DeaD